MFGRLFGSPAPADIKEGAVLIDVRSPAEYMGGHAKGSLNWPLDQLNEHLESNAGLKEKDLVVYCASGARAGVALSMMNRAGFDRVTNVGGVAAVAHLGIE